VKLVYGQFLLLEFQLIVVFCFQVRFFYSFTCQDNLYLVMEYLNGGDVFSLRTLGCLEEEMARVYIAELVWILAISPS
jgi:hypothetical protein